MMNTNTERPCGCEFRRMAYGLAITAIAILCFPVVKAQWFDSHIYALVLVVAVLICISMVGVFAMVMYYQCLVDSNAKR